MAVRKHQLGDLQLLIMQVLWQKGEATVTEVHRGLEPDRALAPTTVATMLRKMEDKGVVSHRTEGRQYVYAPEVDEREVQRTMVGGIVSRLFEGDAKALVAHLVDEGEIDRRELDEIRALIAKRDKGGAA